ncbi:MAG: 1,4-alpha-glucan branching enzyme [Clostridia bacterium]|nr:1,4-alpha-glucan branching enzyme [Clostridia bacterium]
MAKGYLCLVLHAHLPYIHHPEDPNLLEERWLHEAITECYIPIIKVCNNLKKENVDFKITISLSPPLMAMLSNPLLQKRYLKHLEKMIELSKKEVKRTESLPEFQVVAKMYQNLLHQAYLIFHVQYHNNLLQAFKELQESGHVELITCAGTHGYLPLLSIHRESVEAQVKVAVDYFKETFGFQPPGMWLPECGYFPGVDEILRNNGIQYFFVESHGLLYAKPRPKYATLAPLRCPSGVAAFARDIESSKQVWSAQEGYPGDFDYREYYRDIGYDLDYDYIKDYIHPDGIRINTGFKYHRITGKTDYKEVYKPEWAREKAAIHAGNFMFNRQKQVEYFSQFMDRPPIIVCPYDAELFGHWWFEGPQWLEFLMKKIHFDQNEIETIAPSQYLERHSHIQPATPCASSWGHEGYSDVWLDDSNDWIYRHLHRAAKSMINAARAANRSNNYWHHRILNQAARELLLAQSSDWAFIMKTGTMVDYAVRRTNEHLERFDKLIQSLRKGEIDQDWLEEVEERDNIFPSVDYKVYAGI